MGDMRSVRDPIHSFVSFEKNGLINKIIDTEEFQRLRYISQLGLSYFTYPNGTHSRFSHSLGTYWISKRIAEKLKLTEEEERLSIAALLHDIGHCPFSHTLEKKIVPQEHEYYSKKIIESEEHGISTILNEYGIDPKEISGIITSASIPTCLHYLISSQIDADRLDYLLRDSLITGNPHGVHDLERIIQTISLNGNGEIYISKGGWNSIEHYLNCRYQMYKQVYWHHSTVAAEELLEKIIKRTKQVSESGKISLNEKQATIISGDMNLSEYLDIADFDVLSLIREGKRCKDPILSDLSNRFFKRQFFKPIRLGVNDFSKLLDSEEKIKSIVSGKGYETDFYYSRASSSKKEAYKPYSPKTKDQEEAIFIDPECKIEITQEIESINALKTPEEILLFTPEDCRGDVRSVLK